MQLLPSAEHGRFLAVVLLLIAALMVYLVGVHWWFTARQLDISAEMAELRETELKFRQTSAARGAIEKRLADVRVFETSNPAFLPEADFDAAAAGLTQRLKQVIASHARNEQSCQTIMTTYTRSPEKELYERVTLKVRLRCNLEEFAPALHELEGGSPLVFIDDLQIWKQTGYRQPGTNQVTSYLDIRFDLYGYLRKSGGPAPAGAANQPGEAGRAGAP